MSLERQKEVLTNFKRWSANFAKMKSQKKYRERKSKIDPEDKSIDFPPSDGGEEEDFYWNDGDDEKFWPKNAPTIGVSKNFFCDKKNHQLK